MMHMPVQIVRVGRKRKSGKRHPAGRLVQPKDLDVAAIAAAHPDRQGLPESKRAFPVAGTPVGRLFLSGQISAQQLEASRRYARDARGYQQIIGSPKPNAPSLNPMTAGGMSAPVAFSEAEIRRRLDGYNAAFEAVYDAGHRAARAVARVAVYEEWLPDGSSLEDLKRGLSALARHYGLTDHRKSANCRNCALAASTRPQNPIFTSPPRVFVRPALLSTSAPTLIGTSGAISFLITSAPIRGKSHDVIVAVSGGKDSTAQVVKCIELGLRPLAVCATTDHLSAVGRKNLDNIANLCDLIEVTPHKPTRKRSRKIRA
jgi:hypothetical protein